MRRSFAVAMPATLGTLALGPIALAHVGLPPAPHDLWTSWNLSPVMLSSLLLASSLYARGFTNSRRAALRRAVNRLHLAGAAGGARRVAVGPVKRWQAACFGGAMLGLFAALVSPLDALGSSLLTAHMAQHLLLLIVVPSLLVLSAPAYVLAWSLPLAMRRSVAITWNRSVAHSAWKAVSATLCTPLGALLAYTAVVWVWHAPDLYQGALANEAVHVFEHLTFLAAAYLFWYVLVAPLGRHRADRGAAAAMLFGASVQGSALGALMAFSPAAWYPAYSATTFAWGLSPLQDQQLAGVVMWMPIGSIYVVLACLLVWLWLRDTDVGVRPTLRETTAGGE